MALKAKLKTFLLKLDQHSPYPLFYPFIMSEEEKAIFDEAIKESQYYIEFGMGAAHYDPFKNQKR